jgi:hypothetical protein
MKKIIPSIVLSILACVAPLSAADLDPATMSEAEWTEYRFERLTVVRTTPELAAESKQLEADAKVQAKAVEAAMVKADPSVEPLLTKLSALLNGNWYSPAESDTLSAADWQKIRAARSTALAANPDLVSAGKALQEKKQAFNAKVSSALAKADPSLAGLIEKLGNNRAD